MTQLSSNLAISAQGLAKRFGAVKAVSHIDIELHPGEAMGLLGPNGAGKSTTLSMLMGLTRPDAGAAKVFGHAAGSAAARALVGATPQSTGFPDQLSPREVLRYTAARYGEAPNYDDLIGRFGLAQLIDRRIAGFSGGEMRRVALALAFVGNPRVVFLDEPTTGLDTASQQSFREVARDYVAKGGALVLTSHHWDEIEAVCDTLAFIDKGETVLSGHINEMRARATVNRLSFALPADVVPPQWLAGTHDGSRWHVETADSDATLRRLIQDDLPFSNLTLQPLGLPELIERLRTEETVQ